MKNPRHMSAGIISTCVAILVVLLVYISFVKIDLVYTKNGEEIGRQDDVSIFSEIKDPSANLSESLSFTYTDGEQEVDFDHTDFKFKLAMGKLAIENLIGFNWTDASHIIILKAK